MAEVILALGSNLGDRLGYLLEALDKLHHLGQVMSVSPAYLSSAYGKTDQPDFLNAVIIMHTRLEPQKLLEKIKEIESQIGRKNREHWGPREIDIDIILYQQQIIQTPNLAIPHPDFHNRMFVLRPLSDIAPEIVSPIHQKSIRELLNDCPDKTIIELTDAHWYRHGIKV